VLLAKLCVVQIVSEMLRLGACFVVSIKELELEHKIVKVGSILRTTFHFQDLVCGHPSICYSPMYECIFIHRSMFIYLCMNEP
jgi:hypothetical protein